MRVARCIQVLLFFVAKILLLRASFAEERFVRIGGPVPIFFWKRGVRLGEIELLKDEGVKVW
jgi:hypothetical protein